MPTDCTKPAQPPEPKRTHFALLLAVTLVAIVSIAAVMDHCARKVAYFAAERLTADELRREAYEQNAELTIERDALLVKLKSRGAEIELLIAKLDALLLRVEELAGERDDALAKVIEIRELVVRIKLDRDNLANELADSREDGRRTAEEFAKALDAIDRLESLVQSRDRDIACLRADLDCCRQELAKRPNCIHCHQNHRAEPKPKVKNHRRHP